MRLVSRRASHIFGGFSLKKRPIVAHPAVPISGAAVPWRQLPSMLPHCYCVHGGGVLLHSMLLLLLVPQLATSPAPASTAVPPPPSRRLLLDGDGKAHPIGRWMEGANFPSHNVAGGGCLPVVPVNYSDPRLCQGSCDRDPRCLEWTYGPLAAGGHVCCHKDCGPTGLACPAPDDCPSAPCVSGVKDPSTWPRPPPPPPPLPPGPPPSPPSAACRDLNRTLSLQVADESTGIPWQLGAYAVRQTNCVFHDGRYWCFADLVPFASKLFPNTYNTSTHLFSASAVDLIFAYEHEVVPRGPPGSWDHGGAQTPGAAIAADGTVVVVYCGFAKENSSAGSSIGIATASHPNATFTKRGRIAGTVQQGFNHADPQLLLQPHTQELLLYHRRSGGSPGYVVLRSRLPRAVARAGGNWTDFQDAEAVLASVGSPGPGVRAREPMDAKFLPARNQTLLASDQFMWPLVGGPMLDVGFLSTCGDGGPSGVLCTADTGAPLGSLGVKTELAQVTLLQDDTGSIKHVMLARNNAHNKGYGPVVFALRSDLNQPTAGERTCGSGRG